MQNSSIYASLETSIYLPVHVFTCLFMYVFTSCMRPHRLFIYSVASCYAVRLVYVFTYAISISISSHVHTLDIYTFYLYLYLYAYT